MEQKKFGTVLSEENVPINWDRNGLWNDSKISKINTFQTIHSYVPKIIIKFKYYSIYGISTVIACICARKGFWEIGTGGNGYG